MREGGYKYVINIETMVREGGYKYVINIDKEGEGRWIQIRDKHRDKEGEGRWIQIRDKHSQGR